MLRSQGLVWQGTRMTVGQLVAPFVMMAAAALMALVQPERGLAPFGLAMFAAALTMGKGVPAVLLGCLAGIFGRDGLSASVPVSLAAALAGYGVAALIGRWRGRPFAPEGMSSALAGWGILAPGLSIAAAGPWAALRVVAAAVMAAACAPFFRAMLQLRFARRHLMPEERTGLIVFLCAGLAALGQLWMPLAVTAAFMGMLVAAPMGAGSAACAALGAGGVMMLAGLEPARAAALGLCGMIGGLAGSRRRWLPPLALCAASAGAFLIMGAPPGDIACAACAGAAVMLLPEVWPRRARQWMAGESRGACDPDRLAMRLRAESERKLRALSEAFGELSESYRIPADVPDEQSLIGEMRSRLCENCSYYEECWAGGDNRAVRFLCQMISQAIDWAAGDCAEPLFDGELPPEMLRQCHRGRTIPARLGELLEEFAQKRRSELKRGAVNQLISAQFMQAQMLLCGLADAQARPMRVRGRQAARARAALDRAGIGVREVMALRGARQMEIVAALERGRWSPELAARASAQLSSVFGRPYAPGECTGGVEMRFVRLPGLRASASACCEPGCEGMPSGDSHAICELDGDRLLLMLSDGMGSGEDAARESGQTLRLLERFLAAEVPRSLAIETVNELMLARTDSDMFATVDICLIDLATGVAEFSKLAACRSLILRKGEVLTVEGGRLPLGILEGVQPFVRRVQLEPGDVVLMASDGVMDQMERGELTRILTEYAHQPPEILAQTVVRKTKERGIEHQDDMTAICARVTRRRAS